MRNNPNLDSEAPFITTGRFLVGLVLTVATGVTMWGSVKYTIEDNRKQEEANHKEVMRELRGSVHADELERMLNALRWKNRQLNLETPEPSEYMRRESASEFEARKSASAVVDVLGGQPRTVTNPSNPKNSIPNSHASVSTEGERMTPLLSAEGLHD